MGLGNLLCSRPRTSPFRRIKAASRLPALIYAAAPISDVGTVFTSLVNSRPTPSAHTSTREQPHHGEKLANVLNIPPESLGYYCHTGRLENSMGNPEVDNTLSLVSASFHILRSPQSIFS